MNQRYLDEPIFFTPPSGKTSGPRRLYKGGGGGGSPYYASQDKLLGVQADIAQNLYNQYASYAPDTLQMLSSRVGEAQGDAYRNRMRDAAGADAASAGAMAAEDSKRNMMSMGVNPNDPRFAGQMRRDNLSTAANVAGAKNQAATRADDMGFARAQDFMGTISGMPGQAASGLASASSGYGGMGQQQQQGAQANAAGFGQFGGAMASQIMKADGGKIDEPRYALGGRVDMQRLGDWRKRQSTYRGGQASAGDALGQVAMGAAPALLIGGAKDVYKNGMDGTVGKGLRRIGAAVTPAEQAAAEPTMADDNYMLRNDASDVVAQDSAQQAATEAAAQDAATQEMSAAISPAIEEELAATAAQTLFANGGGVRLAMGGMPTMASMGPRAQMRSNVGAGRSGFRQLRMSNQASQSMNMPKLTGFPQGVAPAGEKPAVTTGEASTAARRGLNAGAAASEASDASAKATEATEAARVANETVDTVEQADAALDAADNAATAVEAADTASSGLDAAAGGDAVSSAIKAGAAIAAGEDPTAAAADAAASYAGAEAGAAAGSVIPGVGTVVGGVVGGLLGGAIFADGGKSKGLRRKDFTPGGKVRGPGPEMSDSVAAWLDNGEVVHNAEAVRLAGEDALMEINEHGKQARYGEKSREEAQQDIGEVMIERGQQLTGRAPRLADGGNLGVALGAGVGEWNRQRQMAQDEERHKQSMDMQERQLKMTEQAAGRADEQFGMMKADRDKAAGKERLMRFAATAGQLMEAGDADSLSKMATESYGDGNQYQFYRHADGKKWVMANLGKDGTFQGAQTFDHNPQAFAEFVAGNADPSKVIEFQRDTAKETARTAAQEKLLGTRLAHDTEQGRLDRESRERQTRALASARAGDNGPKLTPEEMKQAQAFASVMANPNATPQELATAQRGMLGIQAVSGLRAGKFPNMSAGKGGGEFTKAPEWAQKRLYELENAIRAEGDPIIFDGDKKKLIAERDALIRTINDTNGTKLPVGDVSGQQQTAAAFEAGMRRGGGGGEGLRAASPGRGVFTDNSGNIQLLEPLSRLNAARRQMQAESSE